METTKKKTAGEMLKDAAAQRETASRVTWTEVAKVPIERGVNRDGLAPLMFSQQVGEGTLPNGRRFDILLNLSSGALMVSVERAPESGETGDESRIYVVDARKMVEAIVAAEFPG